MVATQKERRRGRKRWGVDWTSAWALGPSLVCVDARVLPVLSERLFERVEAVVGAPVADAVGELCCQQVTSAYSSPTRAPWSVPWCIFDLQQRVVPVRSELDWSALMALIALIALIGSDCG